MGAATSIVESLGMIAQATLHVKHEFTLLSEAFAAEQKKIREEAEATKAAVGSSASSSRDGDTSRSFLNTGSDDGFARSGSTGSGGSGRTRRGPSGYTGTRNTYGYDRGDGAFLGNQNGGLQPGRRSSSGSISADANAIVGAIREGRSSGRGGSAL